MDASFNNWIDRDELKLEVIHEPMNEPPGPVRLTIETEATDEGAYRGRYTLAIFGITMVVIMKYMPSGLVDGLLGLPARIARRAGTKAATKDTKTSAAPTAR